MTRHHKERGLCLDKMDKGKNEPKTETGAIRTYVNSALALRNLSLPGFIQVNIGFCPMEQAHRTE